MAGERKPNVLELAIFLQANLRDCGHKVNDGTSLLIANITIDYFAMCGVRVEEEEF